MTPIEVALEVLRIDTAGSQLREQAAKILADRMSEADKRDTPTKEQTGYGLMQNPDLTWKVEPIYAGEGPTNDTNPCCVDEQCPCQETKDPNTHTADGTHYTNLTQMPWIIATNQHTYTFPSTGCTEDRPVVIQATELEIHPDECTASVGHIGRPKIYPLNETFSTMNNAVKAAFSPQTPKTGG